MSILLNVLFLLQFCYSPHLDTTIVKHTTEADFQVFTNTVFKAGEDTKVSVVIINKLAEEWAGYASLELNDMQTKQAVDGLFTNVFPAQYFTVDKKDSARIEFPLSVPNRFPHSVIVSAKLFNKEKMIDSLGIILPYKP